MHALTRRHGKPAALPANFRRIRLELAREPGRPAGDSRIGYLIVAPLDAEDRLDAIGWKQNRGACEAIRFRPDEAPTHGRLVRRRGGWAIHYQDDAGLDDEAGYHLQDERFLIGEYVSIREDDVMHTYRVAAVEHV